MRSNGASPTINYIQFFPSKNDNVLMKTVSILSIPCLCLLLNSLMAQVPGYLGKKLFVKVDFSATPTMINPSANNKGYAVFGENYLFGNGKTSLAFNTRFGMAGGYTISRKNAVTFGVDYLKTGATMTAATRSTSHFAHQYDYDNHYLFYNLIGVTADIGYQVYKPEKGAIAPMGNYVGYHFSTSFIKGEILDKRTVYQITTSTTHPPLGINPQYFHFNLGIEWGNHTIIKDRILLDMALRFNLPIEIKAWGDAIEGANASANNQDNYQAYNQSQFKRMALNRISYHSVVIVRFGVGILP